MSDSTTRFAGLAAGYDRYRPDYPTAAIDFIIQHCGLAPGACFVDVGCGTGISTRLLAQRGLTGIGIEPNADMRQVAGGAPQFRDGRADATGLPDASVDLVLAAQAFHWFANDAALREFARILVPGGWVVLMWNDVDRDDALTGTFARALVELSPEPKIAAWRQSETGEVLMNSPRFANQERREFANEQSLDVEGVLGPGILGVVRAEGRRVAAQFLEERLRAAFDAHQRDGHATMRYRTTVFVGMKRAL